MAHAIFNVSPIKFLTSIQDHIYTVTPSFKNKVYRESNNVNKEQQQQQQQQQQQKNSSSSPVTLQLTLPTDSNMDHELSQQLLQQEMTEIPSCSVPIDIPRSYPFNVPDYDQGLLPHNNMPSTSSYGNHNLISLANSIPNNTQSPYLPADDLTLCFDGLAVKSPTGSYYSHQNGVYSPQQIHSPINIGSPHSPIYFGSPQSPHYGNTNFLTNDAQQQQQQHSFVGSPHSTHFLGSPALTPFVNDRNHNGFGSYLSPTHQQHLSPINSPTNSFVGQNYLFPPATLQTGNYSRPSSPVPDDVILTAFEVNDFINSPYVSPSVASTCASPAPVGFAINTDVNYTNGGDVSEFLFSDTVSTGATCRGVTPASPLTTSNLDDMELIPSAVKRCSPQRQTQRQTQTQTYTQPRHFTFSEDDDNAASSSIKKTTPSGRKAKIHECPYCHHTSNRANNMREHVQIHNPNRTKPHACKLCSRGFARKHDMNRHYVSCKKQYNTKQYKHSSSNNNHIPQPNTS